MAKVTGPFMSLGARGSVAGVLTASKWKGIATMRQKSHPANPKTPLQMAQRNKMSQSVAFWRTILIVSLMKTGWNALATASGKAISGFNAFTSNAIKALQVNADAEIVNEVESSGVTLTATTLASKFVRIRDGMISSELIDEVILFYGNSPTALLSTTEMSQEISGTYGATIGLDASFVVGDKLYYKIVATDSGVTYDASGIMNEVITA